MTTSRPEGSGPQTATSRDLRELFGQTAPVFVSLAGEQHLIEAANSAFVAAVGENRVRTGVPIAELLPEWNEHDVLALLDEVYRSGNPATSRDVPILLGAGEAARQSFFDITLEPRRRADGPITGVWLVGVHTTQLKQAQRLLIKQHALVEQIAREAPLTEVLDGMARTIEDLAPDPVLVSVLLADPDGRHLRHGAAPSLPDFYNKAIDGIATGDGVGSCGTAAHRREPVIVGDISTDPLWADFRDLAQRADLAACWSTPILARDGALLGTFAIYHRRPRVPQDSDLALARVFAGTASLAIERHHIEQSKAAAEAEAAAAREQLVAALRTESRLRTDAERRAEAATQVADQIRNAAAAQAATPHPESCELGGRRGCAAAAEIKIADSWGDAAWGCPHHVEEALLNVRSVFIADEDLGGLADYLIR